MDKIVFLDRDGTINEEVEYLHRPSDLVILPGVSAALKRLKEQGFRLVVVTNQAGVARGYYSEADVDQLHQYMNRLLAEDGAEIDRFFYCPHHPVHGIGAYKKSCHCRKPDIGMFEMAENYFQVDKSHSYMVGDKLLDTEAGHKYGVSSVLVGTGYGKELYKGLTEEQKKKAFDAYAKDMTAAAEWILQKEGA
ncbi:D-glycero-beta-D-manno-heptose 1,7-bisphosphate 7-phosphatase [Lacrimispora amygdalina]|uniref:D,D-heptose 1,7-bisphosphate phosphatase n=1 Tax=Lacrimispora amygdalina TaxID=253257 RepID=A0A3E2NIQ7_9FIRM|nr:D-glycero-beta-D-manno-heptose 1,7-bisphosphate 7-phosphatase [Clostridium indicum]RFZ80884.1 D-glycero-beta-D-manno-heptose 1,7-bisphosphate 7-phosphatase [Clostridium indicum]